MPLYSSIRVEGKRLYEYARNNEEVTLPKREIEIFSIELLELKEKSFLFKVKVSKGTYIRSLCEDIAKRLNTVGYMAELNRTKVGGFEIEQAVFIDDLTEEFESKILNIEKRVSTDLICAYPFLSFKF